jgi:hypothetical protein
VLLSFVAAVLAGLTLFTDSLIFVGVAAVLVQVALVFHEKVFVMAAQDPPLS